MRAETTYESWEVLLLFKPEFCHPQLLESITGV